MKASHKLIELIKRFEGFSPAPYKDAVGIWTIGYGSTHYANGTAVKSTDKHISEKEAVSLLQATLIQYENAVNHFVSVPLNQNQYDALVDFSYNCGIQNLRNSTLLKLINEGHYERAANEFEKWVHAGTRILLGLVRRRQSEHDLFITA